MRIPAPARACLAFAALLVMSGAAMRSTTPSNELESRMAADSVRAGAQVLAGHGDSALALTRSLAALARAKGERGLLARVLRIQGAVIANSGAGAAALVPLKEAERLTLALRDTATLVRVMRWQAFALGEQGRYAEQASVAQRQLQLSRRIGDRTNEAHALHSLGWVALRGSRYPAARETLSMAVALHHALGAMTEEANARATLGSALLGLGAYDEARANYNEVLILARRTGRIGIEARARNDLGVLESRIGDPAAAMRAFRSACARHREMNQWQEALLDLTNVVNNELALGHVAEAMRDAHEGIAIADAKGVRFIRGPFLMLLAECEAVSGRPREARRRLAEALAMGDTLSHEDRAAAHIADARRLAQLGDLAGARAQVADVAREASTLAPETQVEVYTAAADFALRADAPLDARGAALRALRTPGAERAPAGLVRAAVLLGRSALAMGDATAADSAFAQAVHIWERTRVRASDPEWRESQGRDLSADLAVGRGLATLAYTTAPNRISAAFDAMEPLRTRTLLERMAGPLRDTSVAQQPRIATAALAHLQRDVLRAGELLLAVHTSPETTLVFAISRTHVSVHGYPGAMALPERISDLNDLINATRRTPALAVAADSVLTQLAAAWLAPLGSDLEGAERVILAPDGALHALPWEALFAMRDPACVVTRVPSASVLAALRAAPRVASGNRVLAFAGPARDGVALPAARREVNALALRFTSVDVRDVPEDSSAAAPLAPEPYALLHFAAHTEIDEQRPWRSGLVLGRSAAQDASGLWTAAAIARTHLNTPLVMLASCRAASGLAARGEGLTGITSAFLIAGAPAVVASQWPVEDAVTERFEEVFYRELGRGTDAGRALARARAALRVDPRTSAPFHWAGWVLVGDGTARPALRANVLSFRHLSLVLALFAAAVALASAAFGRRAAEEPGSRV